MPRSRRRAPIRSLMRAALMVAAMALLIAPPGEATPAASPTYHGDSMRTGWNANETLLTPAIVGGASFGQVGSVALDAQVDAEPLYVGSVTIAGGVHNVIYVATENDTVYAIDADSGAILKQRNLGAPVPLASLPGACNNNAATVGITGTPVIDVAAKRLYVIAYTYENNAPVYRLHALSIGTLEDTTTAAVVSATQTLAGGTSVSFNPAAERQRAALLEANGHIYAAFASFCDQAVNVSRGWVLGWRTGTLAPLQGSALIDHLAQSPNNFFLSSIWMSGYGIAADETGNLLFVTSNSDRSGTTYDPVLNLSESVIKESPDLTQVLSFFTPDAPGNDVDTLDKHDTDLGAGGVMVLPQQPGAYPRLAVAAGKSGFLYLMNRDSLGGFHNDGIDHVVFSKSQGRCWCGPSYFQGADGIGRVVTSGAEQAFVWKVVTSPTTTLTRESTSDYLSTGQDSGFFTSVSSNGTKANTQIVWAVSRPVDSNPAQIRLYAFDPSAFNKTTRQMPTLFNGVAGTWPNSNGNANLVPLVANGKVYVASYRSIAIFGVLAAPKGAVAAGAPTVIPEPAADPSDERRLSGTVEAIDAHRISLRTRTGAIVTIDDSRAGKGVAIVVGEAISARGAYDGAGVLRADAILRAKGSPALWRPDR